MITNCRTPHRSKGRRDPTRCVIKQYKELIQRRVQWWMWAWSTWQIVFRLFCEASVVWKSTSFSRRYKHLLRCHYEVLCSDVVIWSILYSNFFTVIVTPMYSCKPVTKLFYHIKLHQWLKMSAAGRFTATCEFNILLKAAFFYTMQENWTPIW